jgi:hypothetical protein
MCYSDTIEAILFEAHAYGIREEVLDVAKTLAGQHKYDPAAAYEQAFQQVLTAVCPADTN